MESAHYHWSTYFSGSWLLVHVLMLNKVESFYAVPFVSGSAAIMEHL